MTKEETAIIKWVKIGRVDYHKTIRFTMAFKCHHGEFQNDFSADEVLKMMNYCKVYDDVMGLIGKPCQVEAGWGEQCKFLEMWKE